MEYNIFVESSPRGNVFEYFTFMFRASLNIFVEKKDTENISDIKNVCKK